MAEPKLNRVRFVCSWCTEEQLYKRFVRIYGSRVGNTIPAAPEQAHDWTCIINASYDRIVTPPERTIGVIMEPQWINRRFINALQHNCSYIISHMDLNNERFPRRVGLLPLHIGYHDERITLEKLCATTFEKTKTLSCCISYNKHEPLSVCLYRKRTDFVEMLLRAGVDIDVYGNGWEVCKEFQGDPRIKGSVNDKIDSIASYKYSLAVENCVEDGYFTEKLTDCFATNTIPIYFGCPNIHNWFDKEHVYALQTLDAGGIDEVKRAIESTSLSPVPDKREILQNKYNLLSVVNDFLNNR